ncbi:unnamed protein product [Blepharisma stoltei]|uniref:Uncharacterized protein n=1 Tax=Blepharisma stoltei TaxID=1481888 RepID=A0AAU9IUN0_9CILI|nr:unnamed protein product [Blepharisma stoltei]
MYFLICLVNQNRNFCLYCSLKHKVKILKAFTNVITLVIFQIIQLDNFFWLFRIRLWKKIANEHGEMNNYCLRYKLDKYFLDSW